MRPAAEVVTVLPGMTMQEARAYTRPFISSTSALEGLITQERRRFTIDLSRANTLQGLTLLHFSAQRKHFLSDTSSMTKCVNPLRHSLRLSAKSSRSTNQNAPFERLSTTCC
jgi:hypothetical protein